MHLLDFPPEISQNIIHELVCDIGVVKAWDLRQVCRKIAQGSLLSNFN